VALGPVYLLDKSAWEQRRYDERARARVRQLRESARLAVCVVTMAELLYSSRNVDEMDSDHAQLVQLQFLAMTPIAEQQVVLTLKALAAKGQHRGRPIPDVLIAAIAHAHGAVVLHYDHDFELIAAVTGQRQEWIIPPGTGHRRG
jgi:predicted nucleic acid-binding protein